MGQSVKKNTSYHYKPQIWYAHWTVIRNWHLLKINSPPPPPPPPCRIYASLHWVSIGSGNGLPPVRRQAIAWSNADSLSIGPIGSNFIENWIEILTFSYKKIRLKMSSAKWRPFCPGGDALNTYLMTWPVYDKKDFVYTTTMSLTYVLMQQQFMWHRNQKSDECISKGTEF